MQLTFVGRCHLYGAQNEQCSFSHNRFYSDPPINVHFHTIDSIPILPFFLWFTWREKFEILFGEDSGINFVPDTSPHPNLHLVVGVISTRVEDGYLIHVARDTDIALPQITVDQTRSDLPPVLLKDSKKPGDDLGPKYAQIPVQALAGQGSLFYLSRRNASASSLVKRRPSCYPNRHIVGIFHGKKFASV